MVRDPKLLLADDPTERPRHEEREPCSGLLRSVAEEAGGRARDRARVAGRTALAPRSSLDDGALIKARAEQRAS